ncbi:MAG TPA: universal stress protein [Solirubrobacteraceae bacterium]|nr:universal stress protein [Solirubrobacteraceae bacterium]
MARRRLAGLERVLGVNALFSTAYGNVGSSIYYALGLVAALAVGLTPLVFLFAGALFYCTATTYAEATAMYPEAGGSSLFARQAFNEFWSFFTAWAQMLNYVITIAISAFFAARYAGGVTFDELSTSPGDVFLAVGLIVILALVNVRGVRDAVTVNVVLAVVDFLSQLGLVVAGVFLALNVDVLVENLSFAGTAPTWTDFLIAIPLGTVAYTGIETISNMAGEARDPERSIPAAIKRVMVAVFAIYFTLPWVALAALPVRCAGPGEQGCVTQLGVEKEDGGYASDPIVGIVRNMDFGPLQAAAEAYVAVLAVTILVAATNAGVLGVSRLTYSMGMHRQMPDVLRRLHPRFRTPYIGILAFAGMACVALVPGEAEFLGLIYAFGAMLSFSMAHLAVIRLRVTAPAVPRPYRSPGRLRVRGHDLPPFAVLGVGGTGLAFAVIGALNPPVALAGVGWLALGMAIYVVFRRSRGLDLVSTHKVAIAEPVFEHEAEYDSVLVPLTDGLFQEEVMATAAKLAGPRRRAIHVVVFVTVPYALPLGAPLPEADDAAQSALEEARLHGGRRVSGHVERVRPGQTGRRIIEEATNMRAAAIVMPLPRRVNGASVFGRTLELVLAERPCRVVVESAPPSAQPAASWRRPAATAPR